MDYRILWMRHPSRDFCMLNFQSSLRRLTNWIAATRALSAFRNSLMNKQSPTVMVSNGYKTRSRSSGGWSPARSSVNIAISCNAEVIGAWSQHFSARSDLEPRVACNGGRKTLPYPAMTREIGRSVDKTFVAQVLNQPRVALRAPFGLCC